MPDIAATHETVQAGDRWVEQFAQIVESRDLSNLASVFDPSATWRDANAFSWAMTNYVGLELIRDGMARLIGAAQPRDFEIARSQPPTVEAGLLHVFFTFSTDHRQCGGLAILERRDDESWLATAVLTQVDEFIDHPSALGAHRAEGKVHGVVMNRTWWADDRAAHTRFDDGRPTVVVLGAGHNGLSVAAQLKVLGVESLVIDRNPRVGDSWRSRYSALALHSLIGADHLAYFPFPPSWPGHTPKDKFADHLSNYVSAMDLNVWTDTALAEAAYSDASCEWTIIVRNSAGTTRTLHPRHFVVATGLNGKPKTPRVTDIEVFAGEFVHSGEFQGGAQWNGKKALVVGAGVSGHEIAQDLYEHGAEVTILQRSSTYVVDFTTFTDLWHAPYREDTPFTLAAADMAFNVRPPHTTYELNKSLVRQAALRDAPLLRGLREQGFELDWGPDGTGAIGSHLFRGRDSYQINCGASELIADGRVRIKQGAEVARATATGVVLTDGTALDADLIVFATGYENMLESTKSLLGSAASRVEKIYGLAQDGEYSETWRRSRQTGLYFATGFVGIARWYSKALAVLIKAIEEGLCPVHVADPVVMSQADSTTPS